MGLTIRSIATRTLFDPMHEASNKFVENNQYRQGNTKPLGKCLIIEALNNGKKLVKVG